MLDKSLLKYNSRCELLCPQSNVFRNSYIIVMEVNIMIMEIILLMTTATYASFCAFI